MLEFVIRFTLSDDTSTDEALIASLPHDLRAIADQVAEAWPGSRLDVALGRDGHLARPARLEVSLAHGGRAGIEVRQGRIGAPALAVHSARSTDSGLGTQVEALVSLDRHRALHDDPEYRQSLERVEAVLDGLDPVQARKAQRLLQTFSGAFRELVARDRTGSWAPLSDSPAVDPFYVCVAFEQDGAISRVPLPQLLPEAAASRRTYTVLPGVIQILALLEKIAPEKLDAVRAAGRDYLARRQEWIRRGRYSK